MDITIVSSFVFIISVWPFLFFLLYLFLMLVVPIWVIVHYFVTMSSNLHIWFDLLYIYIYICQDFSSSYIGIIVYVFPEFNDLFIAQKKKKMVMSFFVSSLWNNFGHPIVYIYSICIWRLNYRFYPYLWHIFVTHTYDHISR